MKKKWLLFAITQTILGGVWGALIEIPDRAGFPTTLGYIIWSFTMIIPTVITLKAVNWKVEYNRRAIIYGSLVGLFGAGGQLILFQALRIGPAFLIFPIISLAPVITILLAYIFLKERTSIWGWAGIVLAIIAIPLLSYQSIDGTGSFNFGIWTILSLLVFFAWGAQGFIMKFANKIMNAESIFFYMALTAILLSPIAYFMTDFTQEINWGFDGPYLAFLIHIINAVAALLLVYAYRYGKAMIISPLTNAVSPVITIILSLVIYQVIPNGFIIVGMVIAIIAAFLLTVGEE